MITTAKKLPDLLIRVMENKLCPMVHSSPGIGKSSIAAQIAQDCNLKLIDIRLTMYSPTNLNGFGRINEKAKRSEFVPFNEIPLQDDVIPEGYDGWLILFDELPSAAEAVQASAYKIILDRMVGQHVIHNNTFMMAAGNKKTDNAIVNRMGTAMQSRMVHFEIEADKDSWLEWAYSTKIDMRLCAYVNYKPSILSSFNPKHKDHTFSCGRTLEFASRLIKDSEELDHDDLVLLAGAIGEGHGKEFFAFSKVFAELPLIEDIIADPENAKLSNSPQFMFGVATYVSEYMAEDNVRELLVYMRRFQPEYQVVCAKRACKRNRVLVANPSMMLWVDDLLPHM